MRDVSADAVHKCRRLGIIGAATATTDRESASRERAHLASEREREMTRPHETVRKCDHETVRKCEYPASFCFYTVSAFLVEIGVQHPQGRHNNFLDMGFLAAVIQQGSPTVTVQVLETLEALVFTLKTTSHHLRHGPKIEAVPES